jgi:hypothetical protein
LINDEKIISGEKQNVEINQDANDQQMRDDQKNTE